MFIEYTKQKVGRKVVLIFDFIFLQYLGHLSGTGVGVHLALATGQGDVHETASVRQPLLGAALGSLLLLLLLNFL